MNSELKKNAPVSFFQADDDCELAFRHLKIAPEKSLTVLLIHALAMNSEMWTETVSAMQTEANVYAVDCRGHGLSQKPAGPYNIAHFGADMCSLLDHLNVEQAVVVGCSMGGTVALGMAGRSPERVAGLIAIDTTAWYGEEAITRWAERGNQALANGMASLAEFQCERWFSDEFRQLNEDVVSQALDVFLANDTTAYNEACLMLGRADERAGLSRYQGLTHILIGQDDYATPLPMALGVQALLPGAELKIIPKARHYTPIETPKIVAASIDALLSSL